MGFKLIVISSVMMLDKKKSNMEEYFLIIFVDSRSNNFLSFIYWTALLTAIWLAWPDIPLSSKVIIASIFSYSEISITWCLILSSDHCIFYPSYNSLSFIILKLLNFKYLAHLVNSSSRILPNPSKFPLDKHRRWMMYSLKIKFCLYYRVYIILLMFIL
jgi:hypothetical protein